MFIHYPLLRVTGPSPGFPLLISFCQGFVTLGARQQDFLLGTNCHGSSHPLPTGHLALWYLPRVATVLPAALLTSMEGTPPPLPHVAHKCRQKASIQLLRVRMRKNLVSKLGLSAVARERKGEPVN